MAKRKEPEYLVEFPTRFSGAAIGDGTFRLGFSIDRERLTFAQAAKHFVGKRVIGQLLARSGGAQADQPSLPDADQDVLLNGAFDVKGITLRPKRWSGGFTFSSESANAEALCHFVNREGLIRITTLEDLPEPKRGRPAKDPDDDDDDDDDGDGIFK